MKDPETTARMFDFEDHFESTLSGYLILDPSRRIVRCNACFAGWLGRAPGDLTGTPLASHLAVGSRMLLETHLAPLLLMQGYFEEVAVQLTAGDGSRRDVLINARERRGEDGTPLFIRVAAYRAADRIAYEKNLRSSRDAAETDLSTARATAVLREQFIAVLGHDLRNPLGVMKMGTALLANGTRTRGETELLSVMEQSVNRMAELIDNVMDFARVRLGDGIILTRKSAALGPVLHHVIAELQTQFPDVSIHSSLDLDQAVDCDPARISQILSNLLANAITHGSRIAPVAVRAAISGGVFELSVANHGKVIPAEVLEKLFEPFTREEVRSSQNGLGLGLYIASEIAKAHGGQLEASSTPEETRFTFRMPAGEGV